MKSEGQWNQVIRHKAVVYSRRILVYLGTPMGSEAHNLLGRQYHHKIVRSYNELYTDLTGGLGFYYSSAKITSLIKSVYVTLTWVLRSSITENIKNEKTAWFKKLNKLLCNCSRFYIPYLISWNTYTMEDIKIYSICGNSFNRIKLYILYCTRSSQIYDKGVRITKKIWFHSIQIYGSLFLLLLFFLSYFTFQKALYFSADTVGLQVIFNGHDIYDSHYGPVHNCWLTNHVSHHARS